MSHITWYKISARSVPRLRDFDAASAELLEELRLTNCRLAVDGTDLVVKGQLTDKLRERIRDNKAGLVELVVAGEARWRRIAVWDCTPIPTGIVERRLDKPGSKFWPKDTFTE